MKRNERLQRQKSQRRDVRQMAFDNQRINLYEREIPDSIHTRVIDLNNCYHDDRSRATRSDGSPTGFVKVSGIPINKPFMIEESRVNPAFVVGEGDARNINIRRLDAAVEPVEITDDSSVDFRALGNWWSKFSLGMSIKGRTFLRHIDYDAPGTLAQIQHRIGRRTPPPRSNFTEKGKGANVDQVTSNLESMAPIEDIVPDAHFEINATGIADAVLSAVQCYQGSFKAQTITASDIKNFEMLTLLQFRAKIARARRIACVASGDELLIPFVQETTLTLTGNLAPLALMLGQVKC
ncbi:hypothetical protein DMENIID0001_069690 [Sergentomyia squamirostris]